MAENNLIKKEDLAKAREVDFVYRFVDGLKKLIKVLGVTRKIQKQAGTVLKAYKATGELQDGAVAEGDIIPLSKYRTEAISFDEITIDKWRKSTSIEAIIEKGFDQAVNMTTDAALKDAQKKIKTKMFGNLANGTGRAAGNTFQATLAQIWGQLQVLFEDTEFEAVYFMNPLDVANYLSTAPISTQEAFGMKYISDFLGLGTVILNASVPKGKIYGTAKENIILYYITVNGADIDKAFDFTSDELGYIGIHESSDYTNLTSFDTIMMGIRFFAERVDGVVIGTIGGTVTPSVTFDKSELTLTVGGSETINATVVPAGSQVTWASSNTDVVTVNDGEVIAVAEGTANVTATANGVTATCAVTVSAGA